MMFNNFSLLSAFPFTAKDFTILFKKMFLRKTISVLIKTLHELRVTKVIQILDCISMASPYGKLGVFVHINIE